MSRQSQSAICQRCGRGYVLTTTYQDFLAQRGVKVRSPVLCMTCFLKVGPLPKQKGKVKWFSARKRYGFIATEEGPDVFFHRQQILGSNDNRPKEGQVVRFHLRHSPKGPEALNVELT